MKKIILGLSFILLISCANWTKNPDGTSSYYDSSNGVRYLNLTGDSWNPVLKITDEVEQKSRYEARFLIIENSILGNQTNLELALNYFPDKDLVMFVTNANSNNGLSGYDMFLSELVFSSGGEVISLKITDLNKYSRTFAPGYSLSIQEMQKLKKILNSSSTIIIRVKSNTGSFDLKATSEKFSTFKTMLNLLSENKLTF